MDKISKITVNDTSYIVRPKYYDEETGNVPSDAAKYILNGAGEWVLNPAQEVYISATEPTDDNAKIWFKI